MNDSHVNDLMCIERGEGQSLGHADHSENSDPGAACLQNS